MRLRDKQGGAWAPLAIFSVFVSLALVIGAAYVLTEGFSKNPVTVLTEVLGGESVYDPDPTVDDECEKDPNCVH